jgi:1-acyl-sn-glycerol-3-phosphate acyltransferase
MSDGFYRLVKFVGRGAFWCSSRPLVLGGEGALAGVVPASGPCLLACTHTSPYDIPLLIRHVPRPLDFVSTTEVFASPLVGRFYGALNAFPLDRSRPDPRTVRVLLERLKRGRCVAIFPEGRFCKGEKSVVYTRQIKRGLGRISQLAGAPVVPVVIVNSGAYGRFGAWLPLFRTRYALAYGAPINPAAHAGAEAVEGAVVDAMVGLHALARARLGRGIAGEGSDTTSGPR